MHGTSVMVIDLDLCRHMFTRQIHVVIVFLTNRYVRDCTGKPDAFDLTSSIQNLLSQSNKMQNLLDAALFMGKMPAAKSHSVPGFQTLRVPCLPEIWKLTEAKLRYLPFELSWLPQVLQPAVQSVRALHHSQPRTNCSGKRLVLLVGFLFVVIVPVFPPIIISNRHKLGT